ncbi:MAG: TfoX/Sxy family protein [Schlesneria sp.]
MAFDLLLGERIRNSLSHKKGIEEKKMFGGLGFLLHGNMLVGVWNNALIARVGPDAYQESLREPYAREFDITGKAMKGWILVDAEGVADDDELQRWIQRAAKFVRTLEAR